MGKPSTDTDMEKDAWFGRSAFIEAVAQDLQVAGRSLVLVGFRGTGKTSILAAIRRRLEPSSVTQASRRPSPVAGTDCALLTGLTSSLICEHLAREWNRQLESCTPDEKDLKIFEHDLSVNESALQKLLPAQHEASLLLMLDNFDKLGAEVGNEVASSLLSLLELQTISFGTGALPPSVRLLISTSADLPRLTKHVDDPLSLLWQRLTVHRIRLLELDLHKELANFAKAFHELEKLQQEETDFLKANCGGHPALLTHGLEALAAHKKARSYKTDRCHLVRVYHDLAARASRLPEHILHDLLLIQREHQGTRFHLYRLAYAQKTWLRLATSEEPERPSAFSDGGESLDTQQATLNARLYQWGLLIRAADDSYRLFSDFFADALVERMRSDEDFRQHTLAQVKSKMSALELRVLELFLTNADKELSDDDLMNSCWSSEEPSRSGRAVYSAVTRVQDKLAKHDEYRVLGRISKKARGRGWEYTESSRATARLS